MQEEGSQVVFHNINSTLFIYLFFRDIVNQSSISVKGYEDVATVWGQSGYDPSSAMLCCARP